MTDNEEEKTIDPLANLQKLFLQLVEFILINLKIAVVVLSLVFIVIIFLLLQLFNLLGF